MAFASLGAYSAEYTSTADPATIRLTTQANPGTVLVLLAGTDTTSRTVSSLTDDSSNTWNYEASSNSNGLAVVGWTKVTTALTTADDVLLNWSGGSANTTARLYAFSGLKGSDVGTNSRVHTSATPNLGVTSSADGVQIVVFSHPQDYTIGESLGSFTKLTEIDGAGGPPTMSILAAYKEIAAGSNTCTNDIGVSIPYQAAGVVLPYASARRRRAIVVM